MPKSTMRRAYFNPRPPYGGRPMLLRISSGRASFQPTPSLRRATSRLLAPSIMPEKFQPTPSLRRATKADIDRAKAKEHFNPRPPYGGRLNAVAPQVQEAQISTHALLTEGDGRPGLGAGRRRISTHALLTEGDRLPPGAIPGVGHFNPRPPYGGRRLGSLAPGHAVYISTHALLTEGDGKLEQ